MKQTLTIRPGLLLGLKTTVKGGVHYKRKELPPLNADERWETEKTVDDPNELERATKVRSRASSAIRAVCVPSSFGLLCANAREKELDDALEEQADLIAAFNRTAKTTKVSLWAIKGRIADNDEVAARAIASDVADLIAEMDRSVKEADVESIRRAANQARTMLGILSDDKQRIAGQAIAAARKAARQLVSRVEKNGEKVEKVLTELKLDELRAARFAFLDLDAPAELDGEQAPGVQTQRFAEMAEEEVF